VDLKPHLRKQLWVGTLLLVAGAVAVWLLVLGGIDPMTAFTRVLIPVAVAATYLGNKIEAAAKADAKKK
jgi:hypothetical protein